MLCISHTEREKVFGNLEEDFGKPNNDLPDQEKNQY